MAEITINNSPIHSDSVLTAVFGDTGSSWARYHTGTDFAPTGSTPTNPNLYSVCSGTVVDKINYTGTESLGNQVVIKDDVTGYFWRYCHMNSPALVNIGDKVNTSTQVGVMGATGNVTGIHLHLEYATSQVWSYDYLLNPSSALGIPNVRGTIVHYDGSAPPQPPEPPTPTEYKKTGFNWAVFTKNIRSRRNRNEKNRY